MKIGAERKKVIALVVLVLVAAIVYWMNSSSDEPAPTATARPVADAAAPAAVSAAAVDPTKAAKRRAPSGRPVLREVDYKLVPVDDPTKVDATLRLDLLAKVQAVNVEGGSRNLFQYCVDCKPPETVVAKNMGPIPDPGKVHPGEVTPPTPGPPQVVQPVVQPGPPQPAPINLKYYGYSTKRSDGEKKAFFLDGEDIIVAAEGEIIKKQYKVVRIGVNSVQMEDTSSKSTQTLPIQPDAPV